MDSNDREYEFMLKVKKVYEDNSENGEASIRAVATQMNLSRTKVRKILVTLGVIRSDITKTASKLKAQGMSILQIADEMGVSMATVSTYLPYDTVIYNGEEKSPNAINIERYRERLKIISQQQVFHTNKKHETYEGDKDMKERNEKIYHLHLDLNTNGADKDILSKYGKAKKGITRDVLVSSDMTLHALHYVIQRAFGWQNSHRHHFMLPQEQFACLTENSFKKWVDYCGAYFRFPSKDMEDIYWDDDYNGEVSIRTWFRKKYTGLYQYHGVSEHLLEAKYAVADFCQKNKKILITPAFSEWMSMADEKRKTPIIKNIEDVTCDEADRFFEGGLYELLERLKLSELFAEGDVSPIPEDFTKSALDRCNQNQREFISLHNAMVKGNDYEYWQKMTQLNGNAHPITKTINYQYDYGDGWEVKINIVDVYYSDTAWDHPNKVGYIIPAVTNEQVHDDQTPLFKDGEIIEDEFLAEQIKMTVMNCRPVCIEADGLPVLDDVGGIEGYCELLKALYGKENGSFENANEAKKWATSMGWTGRMGKPEKML